MTSEEFFRELSGLSVADKVKELAGLYFSIEDIAVIIEMEPDELRRIIRYDQQSPLTRAYRAGSLETQIKLRYDTRLFAMKGSPQAETDMHTFLMHQKEAENATY
jgi:hypothetical protein